MAAPGLLSRARAITPSLLLAIVSSSACVPIAWVVPPMKVEIADGARLGIRADAPSDPSPARNDLRASAGVHLANLLRPEETHADVGLGYALTEAGLAQRTIQGAYLEGGPVLARGDGGHTRLSLTIRAEALFPDRYSYGMGYAAFGRLGGELFGYQAPWYLEIPSQLVDRARALRRRRARHVRARLVRRGGRAGPPRRRARDRARRRSRRARPAERRIRLLRRPPAEGLASAVQVSGEKEPAASQGLVPRHRCPRGKPKLRVAVRHVLRDVLGAIGDAGRPRLGCPRPTQRGFRRGRSRRRSRARRGARATEEPVLATERPPRLTDRACLRRCGR